MTKTQKKAVEKRDPATIAREGVAEWFKNLTTNRIALDSGSVLETDFDELQERVEKAVRESRWYENMKPTNPEDKLLAAVMVARDAGYLIGVQVGLRLRQGGA